MNPHLKHSIIIITATALISWAWVAWGADPRLRNNCVSESITNAEEWTQKTGRDARIAIFEIGQSVDHAQAMGQEPDGSWTYLTRHHNDGLLRRWQRHFELPIKRLVGVDIFIKEQEGI
jgi:hypothetical protein